MFDIILMVLVATFGALALYGLMAHRNAETIIGNMRENEQEDHVQMCDLQNERKRLEDTVLALKGECEIHELFADYLTAERDAAKRAHATTAHLSKELIDFLEVKLAGVTAERDELQADINLVAERRANWRERAESAERYIAKILPAAQDAIRAHNAMLEEADQALMYAEEERQVLRDELATKDEWNLLCQQDITTLETLAAASHAEIQDLKISKADDDRMFQMLSGRLESTTVALQKIAAMVQEPSRLEELMQSGFSTDTLEGSTVSLVAAGLQDFVALLTERAQLLEALQAAQKDVVPAAPTAAPSFLDDLPF